MFDSAVRDIRNLIYDEDNFLWDDELKEYIVKHSKEIIELIEPGDYVNGKLIHTVDIRKNSAYIYYGNGKTFTGYQIKSIVTKEQYAAIEYKIGAEG